MVKYIILYMMLQKINKMEDRIFIIRNGNIEERVRFSNGYPTLCITHTKKSIKEL